MITYHKRTKTSLSPLRGAIWLVVLVVLLLGIAGQQVRADSITPARVGDTFIASGKPDVNFGMNSGLWVGYGRPGGYAAEKSLLGFDTTAIPQGSKITSATLRLYLAGWTSGDPPLAIQACRVDSPWTEADVTWAKFGPLSVDCTSAPSIPVPSREDPYAWDVAGVLQAWSDYRVTSNFSLVLQSSVTSGQHYRGFWSKECDTAVCGANKPYLEVVYDPPPLQVRLSQSEQAGGQLQYTIDVKNPNTQIASSVVVTNPLPSGVDFVSASSGGALAGSEVKWTPGALVAGAWWHGSYTVTLKTGVATTAALDLSALDQPDNQVRQTPDSPQVSSGGTATFTSAVTVTGKPPGGPDVAVSDIADAVVTAAPKPPIIVNHGAYVKWNYPGGKEQVSRSNSVIWHALQVWLPLVLRN